MIPYFTMTVPNNNLPWFRNNVFDIWKKIELFKYMNRIDLGRKLTNAFFFLHNCPWVSYWFCFPTPIVLFCPGHLKFGYTAVLFSGMLALVLCLIYRLLVLCPHNHNLPYVNYVIFNEGSFKISNILMLWMFIKKKKKTTTKLNNGFWGEF